MVIMENLLKELLQSVNGINTRLDKIDSGLDNLEGRFDNLENRFDNLEMEVKDIKSDLKLVKEDVNDFKKDMTKEHETTRIELKEEIQHVYDGLQGLYQNVDTIERVTLKNWNDIVRLKSIG